MQDWLREKLDQLDKDFRGGHGFPMIFESQYICYLECYARARGIPPADFWDRYTTECKKDTPKGKTVLGHYSRITDRDKLADRILQFRRHFEGPSKAAFKRPPESEEPEKPKRGRKARVQKPAKSRIGGESDLFVLFGGDE